MKRLLVGLGIMGGWLAIFCGGVYGVRHDFPFGPDHWFKVVFFGVVFLGIAWAIGDDVINPGTK
jgi:hypothetical protein